MKQEDLTAADIVGEIEEMWSHPEIRELYVHALSTYYGMEVDDWTDEALKLFVAAEIFDVGPDKRAEIEAAIGALTRSGLH